MFRSIPEILVQIILFVPLLAYAGQVMIAGSYQIQAQRNGNLVYFTVTVPNTNGYELALFLNLFQVY